MSLASEYVAAANAYHRRAAPRAPTFIYGDYQVAFVTRDGNLSVAAILTIAPNVALQLAEWIRDVFSDDVVTP